jgi:hypothetical protein
MHLTRRNVVVALAGSSLIMAADRSFATGVAAVKALKPGEFVWRPEVSPRGPVVIVVSLPEQLVHVYRNVRDDRRLHVLDRKAWQPNPDRRLHHPAKER